MKLYRYFRLKKYGEPLPLDEIKIQNDNLIEESQGINEDIMKEKIDLDEIKAENITKTSLKKLNPK